MDITKRYYLSKCWESAKYHLAVAVVAALLFVYGLVSDYGNLVDLPSWLKVDSWPKLPLPWATAIVFAALSFIAIEGGVRFHRGTVKKFTDDVDRLRNELANIGGPQLMIGYVQANYLVVQNDGGGTAYTVVLKVPEDGSILSSKPINILKENSSPTTFNLTAAQAMEVARGAKTRPLIVECTDGDCRKFIYRFEKMTDRIGFLLTGKKCIGKDPMLHSLTPQ